MGLVATENGAYDAVFGAPSPATSGTTVTATTAAKWPDPAVVGPYSMSLWPSGVPYTNDIGERVMVTSKSGAVLTIVRAQEGTSAKTVAVGWQMMKGWGAQDGRGALSVGERNLLRNPGFALCQRGDPAGFTAASGAYCADGWYLLTQTSTIVYSRTTPTNSPDKSPYAGVFTQDRVASQRLGALQVVPFSSSFPMRTEPVRLEFMCSVSAYTGNVRYAVIEWTGTADAVTKTIVNDWTSVSYTAGNFFTSTTKNILAVGSLSGLSSTPQLCSIRATVGASCNNLIVFFWTESVQPTNSILVVTDFWLVPDTLSAPFTPRSMAAEIDLCQRFFGKSYNLDTAPGAASNNVGASGFNIQPAEASHPIIFGRPFTTRMRATPTIVFYDYAGNSGKISEISADLGTITNNITPSGGATEAGETSVAVLHDPSGSVGGLLYHHTRDADL